MPVKQEEKRVKIAAEIPASTYKYLEKISKYYRTNGNISHAIRLMIEDVGKGLESGNLLARVSKGGINEHSANEMLGKVSTDIQE
jgi:hypothetical protein